MWVDVRVRVQRPDDVLEVCPTILTEDGMQAQHLGATLALYKLVKGQVSFKIILILVRKVLALYISLISSVL